MCTAPQRQRGVPWCPLCWAVSRDMVTSLGGDLWHNQSDLEECCNAHPPEAAAPAAIPGGMRGGQDVGPAVQGCHRGPRVSLCSPPAGIDVAHLCRNSGLCVDTGNTHFCRCQAGYTGSYCEEQVDECSPNPCQNGATCTDYLGGYSCEVGAAGGRDAQGEGTGSCLSAAQGAAPASGWLGAPLPS